MLGLQPPVLPHKPVNHTLMITLIMRPTLFPAGLPLNLTLVVPPPLLAFDTCISKTKLLSLTLIGGIVVPVFAVTGLPAN